jgi:hypothetical protein
MCAARRFQRIGPMGLPALGLRLQKTVETRIPLNPRFLARRMPSGEWAEPIPLAGR